MLILNIIDNTIQLDDKIENYFVLLSYCKKYNIIFNYNKSIKTKDSILSNIDLTNLHQNLLSLVTNNNNIILIVTINKYIINLLQYYILNDDIIKEFYNFDNDIKLFNKYNFFTFDYVCIHIDCGNIMNDTKNYLSINYFIDIYNNLDQSYKLLKLVIISNQNISNYFNNYLLITNDNDNDKLNIMIHSKYLITSNNKLDYYAKLLNKNNFI